MTSTASTTLIPAPASQRGPFRLAVAMVVVTSLVLLMGAMVTSTGSGMAFTDWPLSDGALMPERALVTLPGFLEHFHRLFGATLGLLSLTLTVWVLWKRVGSLALRKLVGFGLVLICVQGAFGGVGVLKQLPVFTSVSHATLAQVTIATFTLIAFSLSRRAQVLPNVSREQAGSLRGLTTTALVLLLVQTVIGAIARHTNEPGALWLHVGNAMIVFFVLVIAAGAATGKLGAVAGVRTLSRWLIALLMLQIGLGFTALLVRQGKHPENIQVLWRCGLISLHVLVGAALTLVVTLLAAHVYRVSRQSPHGAGI